MGISTNLWRKSYRERRESLRRPIRALVLCRCLAFKRGYGCWPYDKADVDILLSLTNTLDNTIRKAASLVPRVTYVDTRDVFAGHTACSQKPWVVPLFTFTRPKNWLHPTVDGHMAIAGRVAVKLALSKQ